MARQGPVERLDKERILSGLPATARDALRSFAVLGVIDSTNRFLMEGAAFTGPGVHACVAEAQSAGRGRRGRGWVSPFGANLYLSLLYERDATAQSLQGLSLATGVAVARALRSIDVSGIALKWPNDILLDGCKLGGILVETEGGHSGPSRVVTGIGINVDMPDRAGAGIDQPWTDLGSHDVHPGRNRLASRVLAEVLAAHVQFAAVGFEAFRGAWDTLDALRDRSVELRSGSSRRTGTARGVDAAGALLLEIDGRCEPVLSGDVSLRPAT